jgi:hypothetical protein
MPNTGDHREFTRITALLEAEVVGGGRTLSGVTRDVSLKGMLLACPESLPVGTGCSCTLFLDGRHGQARVRADGVVARVLDQAIALEFHALIDPESYEFLQNLILYNAADPKRVEDEFKSHLGLKRQP